MIITKTKPIVRLNMTYDNIAVWLFITNLYAGVNLIIKYLDVHKVTYNKIKLLKFLKMC